MRNGSLVDRHPILALLIATVAVLKVALGVNFLIFNPTFLIWHSPNWIWGSILIFLGSGALASLFILRSQRAVRAFTLASAVNAAILAAGTSEPWLDGKGSLQLPLFYLWMSVTLVYFLVEPFLNPATAKNGDGGEL